MTLNLYNTSLAICLFAFIERKVIFILKTLPYNFLQQKSKQPANSKVIITITRTIRSLNSVGVKEF